MNCYFNDITKLDHVESILEPLFLFSIVWSIGCTTDYEGHLKFNTFLRAKMNENKV